MWVKLGIEDLHIILLSIFEFRQNQYGEKPTLQWGWRVCVNETSPCFLQFSTDIDKVRSGTCSQNFSGSCEIRDNGTVRATPYVGVYSNFSPCLRHLSPDLSEIRYKRSERDAAEFIIVSWKSLLGKSIFLLQAQMTLCLVCTETLDDISKVKNSLVKSVYHVAWNTPFLVITECFSMPHG
jgi:hypothetical protein